MSVSCFRISDATAMHAEPQGTLKANGWLPGTWVKYIHSPTVASGTVIAVDICKPGDFPGGWIGSGSQLLLGGFDCSHANQNEPTGRWTADVNMQLFAKEHNLISTFDSDKQLSFQGTGIANVTLAQDGIVKFYVFERYDKAYRDSNGMSGGLLDWESTVGRKVLYVSSRGLMTCEQEDTTCIPIPRCIVRIGQDELGVFFITLSI